MMNLDFNLIKDLNSLQKRLFQENKPEFILANESLNIVKGHPNYLEVFKNCNLKKFLSLFLKYSIINFYYLFSSLFFYKSKRINIKKNINFLVVSHFLSSNKTSHINNRDFYFDEFEKNMNFKKKNNFKILINHSKKFRNGLYKKDKIILQKYTSFRHSIYILINLYFLFMKYFLTSLIKNKKESYLLKIISIEFINPGTFKNLIIKKNLEDIIFGLNIKKVFFTFEGFPWERFLCQIIKKNCENSKIFGYQFAILFKYQNSIFLNIPKIYLPNIILTSGIMNYKILKKKFFDISIIGSSRFSKNKKKNLNKKNCLILPEGMDSECEILSDFAIKCAHEIPHINFIIRFHPLTDLNKINEYLIKKINYKKLNNIKLSRKDLSYDLKRSSICLHRGSTSAITAMQSGVMPIYLNFHKNLNIDPMFQINRKSRYIENVEDLKNFISKSPIDKLRILKKIKKSSKNYFTKFNHQELTKLVKE